MLTLRDIKKTMKLTNADIGRLLGKSPSVVGCMLRGMHIRVMHDSEIEALADVLGITFERCWLSMIESYEEYAGIPTGTGEYERADVVRAQVWQEMGRPCQPPRELAVVDSQVIRRQIARDVRSKV